MEINLARLIGNVSTDTCMYDRKAYITSPSPLKKDLYRLFKKNDKLIILDIGGCEGEDSIKYAKIFPKASIFVFEPLPKNQNLIKRNLQQYQATNIELIPMALSDSCGYADFHVSSGRPGDFEKNADWDFGNKSSSLLTPGKDMSAFPWLHFSEIVSVETITLKYFLDSRHLQEIDFIHMDVQGAELKVLLGAQEKLNHVKAIWLEVADVKLYAGQPLRTDIENFMKNKDFYLIRSSMSGEFGDQLYLNARFFRTLSAFKNFIQFHFKKKFYQA